MIATNSFMPNNNFVSLSQKMTSTTQCTDKINVNDKKRIRKMSSDYSFSDQSSDEDFVPSVQKQKNKKKTHKKKKSNAPPKTLNKITSKVNDAFMLMMKKSPKEPTDILVDSQKINTLSPDLVDSEVIASENIDKENKVIKKCEANNQVLPDSIQSEQCQGTLKKNSSIMNNFLKKSSNLKMSKLSKTCTTTQNEDNKVSKTEDEENLEEEETAPGILKKSAPQSDTANNAFSLLMANRNKKVSFAADESTSSIECLEETVPLQASSEQNNAPNIATYFIVTPKKPSQNSDSKTTKPPVQEKEPFSVASDKADSFKKESLQNPSTVVKDKDSLDEISISNEEVKAAPKQNDSRATQLLSKAGNKLCKKRELTGCSDQDDAELDSLTSKMYDLTQKLKKHKTVSSDSENEVDLDKLTSKMHRLTKKIKKSKSKITDACQAGGSKLCDKLNGRNQYSFKDCDINVENADLLKCSPLKEELETISKYCKKDESPSISTFFKKVSKTEFNSTRDKHVLTVHADVHPPPSTRTSPSRKLEILEQKPPTISPSKRDKADDDFDKIEFLGQHELNGSEDSVLNSEKETDMVHECNVEVSQSKDSMTSPSKSLKQEDDSEKELEDDELAKGGESEDSEEMFDISQDVMMDKSESQPNKTTSFLKFRWNSKLSLRNRKIAADSEDVPSEENSNSCLIYDESHSEESSDACVTTASDGQQDNGTADGQSQKQSSDKDEFTSRNSAKPEQNSTLSGTRRLFTSTEESSSEDDEFQSNEKKIKKKCEEENAGDDSDFVLSDVGSNDEEKCNEKKDGCKSKKSSSVAKKSKCGASSNQSKQVGIGMFFAVKTSSDTKKNTDFETRISEHKPESSSDLEKDVIGASVSPSIEEVTHVENNKTDLPNKLVHAIEEEAKQDSENISMPVSAGTEENQILCRRSRRASKIVDYSLVVNKLDEIIDELPKKKTVTPTRRQTTKGSTRKSSSKKPAVVHMEKTEMVEESIQKRSIGLTDIELAISKTELASEEIKCLDENKTCNENKPTTSLGRRKSRRARTSLLSYFEGTKDDEEDNNETKQTVEKTPKSPDVVELDEVMPPLPPSVCKAPLAPIFVKSKPSLPPREDDIAIISPPRKEKAVEESVKEEPVTSGASQQLQIVEDHWPLLAPCHVSAKEESLQMAPNVPFLQPKLSAIDEGVDPFPSKGLPLPLSPRKNRKEGRLPPDSHVPLTAPQTLKCLSELQQAHPSENISELFAHYLACRRRAEESARRDYKSSGMTESDSVTILEKGDGKTTVKRKRKSTDGAPKKRRCLSKSRSSSNNDDSAHVTEEAEVSIPPYLWTDLFAPLHANHIMGNRAKISDLQCWLSKWQQRCQEQQKGSFSPCKKAPKRRGPLTPSRHAHLRAADSDWASDFSYDSDDSNAASNNVSANLVMLAGPPGAGKTALVYALAQQLGYKVLEVNASSRRTGKSVLSKLSEATQSQSVKQSQSHFLTAAQSHELLANQSPSKPPPLNPIASLFQKKQEANGGKLKENTKKQEANGRKVKESTKKQESSGGKVKENTKKQESNGGKVKESTKGKKGRKSVSPNVCAASKAIKKSKLSLAKKKIFKGNAKKLVKLSAEGKKEEIEGGKKKEFTLLLFEDIDIVFDDKDEGFLSAVNSIMLTSKRPIIATTSGGLRGQQLLKCPHTVYGIDRPNKQMLVLHLQLIALAATGCAVSPPLLGRLAEKGDIRSAVLGLQFLLLGVKQSRSSCVIPSNLENIATLQDLFPGVTFDETETIPLFGTRKQSRTDGQKSFAGQSKENFSGSVQEISLFSVDGKRCALPHPIHHTKTHIFLPSLLPLPKHSYPERKKKYPFSLDDPTLKKTPLYQKYTWLDIESESDEEKDNLPPEEEKKTLCELRNFRKNSIDEKNTVEDTEKIGEISDKLEGKKGPTEIQRVNFRSLNCLSKLCSNLADVDILSQSTYFSECDYFSPDFANSNYFPCNNSVDKLLNNRLLTRVYNNNSELDFLHPVSNISLIDSLEDSHSLGAYCNPQHSRKPIVNELNSRNLAFYQSKMVNIIEVSSSDGMSLSDVSCSVPDVFFECSKNISMGELTVSECSKNISMGELTVSECSNNRFLCTKLFSLLPLKLRTWSAFSTEVLPMLRGLTRQDCLNEAVAQLKRSRRRPVSHRAGGALICAVGLGGLGEADLLRMANALLDG